MGQHVEAAMRDHEEAGKRYRRAERSGSGEDQLEMDQLNNSARNVIRAVIKESGRAYIYQLNSAPACREVHNAVECPNFCCVFVAGERIEDLIQLIDARREAPYDGARRDAVRVAAIFACAGRNKALTLVWA